MALPSEITTGTCYLQLYINHILALQSRGSMFTPSSLLTPFAHSFDVLQRALSPKTTV